MLWALKGWREHGKVRLWHRQLEPLAHRVDLKAEAHVLVPSVPQVVLPLVTQKALLSIPAHFFLFPSVLGSMPPLKDQPPTQTFTLGSIHLISLSASLHR